MSTRRNVACPEGHGICVSGPHGLVVVSDCNAKQLFIYSLIDGTLIRSTGSKGSGKGQFDFRNGGLCVSPDGDSVLVAESRNNRVQEVRLVDGSWVRFAGEGVLDKPEFVDCNTHTIAVSESGNHRISMLSWADGSMRAQFGSLGCGSGQLLYPRGVRLLANNSGVAVADCSNNRLCVFTLHGEFVAAMGSTEPGLNHPSDVLERASDASYVVADRGRCSLFFKTEIRKESGVTAKLYCRRVSGQGKINNLNTLAKLPNDGCVALGVERIYQLAHLQARLAWMCGCARVM